MHMDLTKAIKQEKGVGAIFERSRPPEGSSIFQALFQLQAICKKITDM